MDACCKRFPWLGCADDELPDELEDYYYFFFAMPKKFFCAKVGPQVILILFLKLLILILAFKYYILYTCESTSVNFKYFLSTSQDILFYLIATRGYLKEKIQILFNSFEIIPLHKI